MVAPEDLDPPLSIDHWRLVALDIDGTLMHWGGSISDHVADAVERVRMSRNHVVLATGRNIAATLPVAQRLGIRRGWAVCSNGAVTIRLSPHAPGGYEIIHTVTFNPRAALELVRTEMPGAFFAKSAVLQTPADLAKSSLSDRLACAFAILTSRS